MIFLARGAVRLRTGKLAEIRDVDGCHYCSESFAELRCPRELVIQKPNKGFVALSNSFDSLAGGGAIGFKQHGHCYLAGDSIGSLPLKVALCGRHLFEDFEIWRASFFIVHSHNVKQVKPSEQRSKNSVANPPVSEKFSFEEGRTVCLNQ